MVTTWVRHLIAMALVVGAASTAVAAEQDGTWSVAKASGEVWITASGAQQASLTGEDVLKPGDTIRTGHNGRVLLVRGEQTILIAPNSVIGLPSQKIDGMSTTILQQAGSILLEVDKRKVKHFEVETPYLAAVVKGTHFSVTVKANSTRVGVMRGQVEVSDFKTGQIAQVTPGQAATVFSHGKHGLVLSGSGPFTPIEQGKPRASSINRIPVPRGGLAAPRNAGSGQVIRALGHVTSNAAQHHEVGGHAMRSGVVRISTALGEVRLNVQKATHGLAHGSNPPTSVRGSRHKESYTVWGDTKLSTSGNISSGQAISNGSGSSATAVSAGTGASTTSAAAGAAAAVAAATAAGSNSGHENGNGATGNGKGNGDGHGNGDGNGKNGWNPPGNGNGNGHGNGNGNGNGSGHGKGH